MGLVLQHFQGHIFQICITAGLLGHCCDVKSRADPAGESPAVGFPYMVSPLGPLMIFMNEYPTFRLKPFLPFITVCLAGLSAFHSTVSF